MNLTYKIMALVEEHEKTGRDVIVERMQKLTNVDELVEIFGISKFTAISWINGKRTQKIPLLRLCYLASYNNKNVYYFLGRENYDYDITKEFIRLNEIYEKVDKNVICDAIEEYYGNRKEALGAEKGDARWNAISEATGANRNTINSWMNRSRKNVKMGFVNLCRLALFVGVGVERFLGL